MDEDDSTNDYPCGPAMFMRLGWSTPADDHDASVNADMMDPFDGLFDESDTEIGSGEETDCSIDSNTSLHAPPYSPICGTSYSFEESSCTLEALTDSSPKTSENTVMSTPTSSIQYSSCFPTISMSVSPSSLTPDQLPNATTTDENSGKLSYVS